MPKHNKNGRKKPSTKRKAKREIRKSGRKPVIIKKRTIRKYGPGLTKQKKTAVGKKKKPTQKGKVKKTIKYITSVPKPSAARKRRKAAKKRLKKYGKPLI